MAKRTRWAGGAMALGLLGSVALSSAAGASGNGATVTDASGPTFVYGADNPFADAHVEIHGVQTPGGHLTVSLHVTGIDPSLAGMTVPAHVHVGTCSADPTSAGGHYKNTDLPASDPEAREVWLDFTVDKGGNGSAVVQRDWVFASHAQSVVFHDPQTPTTRLVCTDAPFHS